MHSNTLRCLTALGLIAALSACGPRSDTTRTDANSSTATTFDDTPIAADNTTDAMAAAPTAQSFVDTAAKSDAFEIAAAKLAQTNASSADVKAFAIKMIAAHTESTAKIKKASAAATPAITPDPALNADQTAKLADLGKLTGTDFDKAYVAGQLAAHQEALTLMKGYASSGDVPSLKAAAGEIAPIVQDHLTMVEKLAAK